MEIKIYIWKKYLKYFVYFIVDDRCLSAGYEQQFEQWTTANIAWYIYLNNRNCMGHHVYSESC